MPQTRVAVVGSANMDLVAMAPALPRQGETMLGTDFVMVPGGKGANQAVAAVRAGASCVFLGAIGLDAFGVTLKARITAAGVDTSQLRVVYGASGVALVMVNAQGENAIVVTPGANEALVDLTEDELATVRAADVLVAQLEIPVQTVTAAAVAARDAGTRVILNAAPARDLPPELLAAVDLLVVNEGEAQALAGRGREEPRALLDLAPGPCSPSAVRAPGTSTGTAPRCTCRRYRSTWSTPPPPVTRSPPRWPSAGARGATWSTRCAGRRRPAPPASASSARRWRYRDAPRSTSCTYQPERVPR